MGDTYYLRKSCAMSFIMAVITRIIVPVFLIICCVYYRFIYWEINNIAYGQNKKRDHRLHLEPYLNNFLEILHFISFLGTLIANIWWTAHLWNVSKTIPITYYET